MLWMKLNQIKVLIFAYHHSLYHKLIFLETRIWLFYRYKRLFSFFKTDMVDKLICEFKLNAFVVCWNIAIKRLFDFFLQNWWFFFDNVVDDTIYFFSVFKWRYFKLIYLKNAILQIFRNFIYLIFYLFIF